MEDKHPRLCAPPPLSLLAQLLPRRLLRASPRPLPLLLLLPEQNPPLHQRLAGRQQLGLPRRVVHHQGEQTAAEELGRALSVVLSLLLCGPRRSLPLLLGGGIVGEEPLLQGLAQELAHVVLLPRVVHLFAHACVGAFDVKKPY